MLRSMHPMRHGTPNAVPTGGPNPYGSHPGQPTAGGAGGPAAAGAANSNADTKKSLRQEDSMIARTREALAAINTSGGSDEALDGAMPTSVRQLWSDAVRQTADAVHLQFEAKEAKADDSVAKKKAEDGKDAAQESVAAFRSAIDQTEIDMRNAVACIDQMLAANRYLPIVTHPSRFEPSAPGMQPSSTPDYLTYAQYLETCRNQIKFTRDIRAMLAQTADDVVNHRY